MSNPNMSPVDAALDYAQHRNNPGKPSDLWTNTSYPDRSPGAKIIDLDVVCGETIPVKCMMILADEVRRLRFMMENPT